MAIKYTDIADKQNDPTMGNRNLPVLQKGDVTIAIASYTLLENNSELAEDILKIMRLPQGAVILKDQCKIVTDGGSTALSLDIEFEPDDGSGKLVYSATTDVKTAGRVWEQLASTNGDYVPENKRLPSDGWLQAVYSLNDTPSGTLYFIIAYAVVT